MAFTRKTLMLLIVTSALLALTSLSSMAALIGTVTGSKVNVRTAPSTTSGIIDTLPQDTIVDVIAYGEPWITVSYGDQVGYMSSDYVSVSVLESDSSQSALRVAGTITGNSVRFRTEPNTSCDVITTFAKGTVVNVVEKLDGWYKVTYGEQTGYVSADYLVLGDASVSRGSSDRAAEMVEYAKQFLGVPYKYGGASPKGFDCSGFVYYVLGQFDISVPHGATSQYNATAHVSRSELTMGDLVFFSTSAGGSKIGHVGIYISDGKFIHASSPGDVVKIDSIKSGYYNTHYYGASRVIR